MKIVPKKHISISVLILILVLLISFLWRVPAITGKTFAFTYDVGRDMLTLSDMVYNHRISLIGPTTGLQGVFYGPWWYWWLTPAFVISQGNPQGVALFILFCGLLAAVMGYIVGKKINGELLGLIFAALLSMTPIMFGLTTQIWNPNLAPIFIVLLLYCLTRLDTASKQWLWFSLIGSLLMLVVESEIVFGTLFSIGYIVGMFVLQKKHLTVRNIISFLLGTLIILSPRIFFELRHNFLMTRSIFGSGLHGNSHNIVLSFFFHLPDRLIILDKLWNDSVGGSSILLGTLLLFVTISILFKFYKKSRNNEKVFLKLCCIIIGTFLLGLSFFQHDIWPHYLVGLPIVFFLLFSIILTLMYRFLNKKLAIAVIFISLFIAIQPLRILANYGKETIGDASFYRNQLQVLDYIYADAKGRDFKYIVYTPPVHDYTYQYLFSWYGKKQYHYIPVEKSPLAYFIIEPDVYYPKRVTDWLKIRENDGKIINEKVFPSGIIVQTRVNNL